MVILGMPCSWPTHITLQIFQRIIAGIINLKSFLNNEYSLVELENGPPIKGMFKLNVDDSKIKNVSDL